MDDCTIEPLEHLSDEEYWRREADRLLTDATYLLAMYRDGDIGFEEFYKWSARWLDQAGRLPSNVLDKTQHVD